MKTSEKGLKLIKEFEGLRLEPYKCDVGVWTIGYGHTKGINQNTKPITKEQAEDFLKDDLKFFEGLVNNKKYVPQQINQNQFDALVSFTFNLGGGNLKELFNDNYPPWTKNSFPYCR